MRIRNASKRLAFALPMLALLLCGGCIIEDDDGPLEELGEEIEDVFD